MEEENKKIQMVTNTMEIGEIMKEVEKEFLNFQLDKFSMENGKMIK